MLHIALIFFTALLLPDLYIYGVHIHPRTKRPLLRALYWLPTLLLTAAYLWLMTSDNAMSHNFRGIGLLANITLLLVFPKLLFALCSLLGKLFRFPHKIYTTYKSHKTYKPCRIEVAIGLALALAGFCLVLYGATVGPTRFEVKKVEYCSADLPAGFNDYRIVQISDIHIGSWAGKPEAIQQMVDLVNAQWADLIVFTGDLVNQRADELDGFQEILSQLHAPDGVYSILGNHDYGTYYHWPSPEAERENLAYLIRQEGAMGWKMLNNAHDVIRQGEDSIILVGVENDGEPPFPRKADLTRALEHRIGTSVEDADDGNNEESDLELISRHISLITQLESVSVPQFAVKRSDGAFRILLSHNPTHWRREVLPESDIQLTLSGHTHAMQISLFGHSLAELRYPEWSGMYREGKRSLYVNVGIGYVGLPFRFGAWPEITVFTLRKFR